MSTYGHSFFLLLLVKSTKKIVLLIKQIVVSTKKLCMNESKQVFVTSTTVSSVYINIYVLNKTEMCIWGKLALGGR